MPNKINKILSQRQRVYEGLERLADKDISIAYKRASEAVKNKIAELFEKYEYPTETELRKFGRINKLKAAIRAEINKVNRIASNVTNSYKKKSLVEGYYSSGYAFEVGTGINLNFKILPEKSIKFAMEDNTWLEALRNRNSELATNINFELETMLRQNARQEIIEGLEEGKPYNKIAKEISERFNITRGRSSVIARTEMHKAHSKGRVEGINTATESAKRLGLVTQKVWRHNGAKEPRPDHVQMDGVPADENGVFTLPDGTTTEAPGLTGLPGHDINCSCSAEFEILGLDEIDIIDEDLQKMTFDEWERT